METDELDVAKNIDGLDHSAYVNFKMDLVSELLGEGGPEESEISSYRMPLPKHHRNEIPKEP